MYTKTLKKYIFKAMEKIPFFQKFKTAGNTMKEEIKSGINERDWGWLFLYFLTVIFLLWLGYLGIRSLIGTAYPTKETTATTSTITAIQSNVATNVTGNVNQSLTLAKNILP